MDPQNQDDSVTSVGDPGGAGPNLDLSCGYIPSAQLVDTAFRSGQQACSHPSQDQVVQIPTGVSGVSMVVVRVPNHVTDPNLPTSGGDNSTVAVFEFQESGPMTASLSAPCSAHALVQAVGAHGGVAGASTVAPIGPPTCSDGYAIETMAAGGPQGQPAGVVFEGTGAGWKVLGGGDPFSVGQACSLISPKALLQFQQLPPGMGCPAFGDSTYVPSQAGGAAQEADCSLPANEQKVCAAALELFVSESDLVKYVTTDISKFLSAVSDVINPPPSTYVAMGDSYSSGEGADWPAGFSGFPQLPGCDWRLYQDPAGSPRDTDHLDGAYIDNNVQSLRSGHCQNSSTNDQVGDTCHRSITAYAHVFDRLDQVPNRKLVFVACSGATVHTALAGYPANQTNRKGEKSQLLQLDSATSLVTLTLGGNDVGFADDAKVCVTPTKNEYDCINPDQPDAGSSATPLLKALGYVTTPGSSNDGLFRSYNPADTAPPQGLSHASVSSQLSALVKTSDGLDLRDRLVFLYRVMHKLAPNARILVLGYPQFFPSNPTSNAAHFSVQEQEWVNQRIATLDNVVQSAVSLSGVTQYVDVNNVLDGHQLVNGGSLDFTVDQSGNASCSGGEYLNDVDLTEGYFGSPELLHPNPCGHQLEGQRLAAAFQQTSSPQPFHLPDLPPSGVIKATIHHGNFPFGCHSTFTASVNAARTGDVSQFIWFDETGNERGTGSTLEMDSVHNAFKLYLETVGNNGQVRYSFFHGSVC